MEGRRTGRLDLLSSLPPCCLSGSYLTLLRISRLLRLTLWPRPPLHLLHLLCFAPRPVPPLLLHLSIPFSDSLVSFEPLKAPGRLWKVPVHAFISSLCPAFPFTPPPLSLHLRAAMQPPPRLCPGRLLLQAKSKSRGRYVADTNTCSV